jgi:exonuclease VII small subunit
MSSPGHWMTRRPVPPVGDYDELVDRLESVAADLDEIAFDRLREAVAEGELARPHGDKELMQARRAIEKAAGILRRLGDDQST